MKYITYLEAKINNWYRNAAIDHGVSGRFLEARAEGNDLVITFEEDGSRLTSRVAWFREYSPEQVYNIWMESDCGEAA